MTSEPAGFLEQETHLWPVEGEPDACDVAVHYGSVVFIFHVSRIFLQRRKLDSHVGVDWTPLQKGEDTAGIGLPLVGFQPANLDWRSNSSMETFRRQLQQYFDPAKAFDFPWTQILQHAAAQVNRFVATGGDLQMAKYVAQVQPDYLIRSIWPARLRPTIWYGQGETGKGQISVASCVSLCSGGNFGGLRTKELPRGVVYVDYEDDYEEFSTRVSRIVNGLNMDIPANLRRFDPRGRLFVDIADQLKAKIDAQGGAGAIVVDSAIPAVGGDALDSQPVGQFFNALAWLGIPALVIAHETKAGNDEFPFGSQLWRTEAGMTVNFQASAEATRNAQGQYVRDVLLRCTKANNVARFSPLAFQLVFTDDEEAQGAPSARPLASTWILQIDPATVSPELQGKLPPLRRIVAMLRGRDDEPTVKEIADTADLSPKTVDNLLRRNPSMFASEGGGRGAGNAAKWRLIQGAKP